RLRLLAQSVLETLLAQEAFVDEQLSERAPGDLASCFHRPSIGRHARSLKSNRRIPGSSRGALTSRARARRASRETPSALPGLPRSCAARRSAARSLLPRAACA